MPVQLIGNPAQRTESGLEKLARMLEMARSAQGMGLDAEKLELARQQAQRETEGLDLKRDEFKRLKEGVLTPKEQLEYSKDYDVSDVAKPGAFRLKAPDGKDVYYSPRNKQDDKNAPLTQSGLADYVKAGGRVVAPGRGTLDVTAYGVDGRRTVVGLVPPPKTPVSNYPKPTEKALETLATKNAGKAAIANQIDSVVQTLNDPSVSEEQKLVQGRQLIKTLNSSEGADAVGAEEVKRLGSLLEYQILNMRNPGPFWGRAPISDFSKQAQLTSEAIRRAISANEKQMGELGRGGSLGSPAIASAPAPSADQGAPPAKNAGISMSLPQANGQSAAPRPGMVKVRKGAEVLWVPKEDATAAARDGYQVIP